MLRMSPLRGDQSVATPTSSGRFASQNQARPRSLAQASSGDCCSRTLVAHAWQGLAGPGPALVHSSADINFDFLSQTPNSQGL